jgi:peptidyl-prolyl cis-trans isomerase A (cyclophilin A)
MATDVVLETTRGDVVLRVHEDWSPKGAEHFLRLVKAGYYDGAPWFRVIDGFVAQCGISADWKLNREWDRLSVEDEPVVAGNQRGHVSFGRTAEPNSRSTHIFINYKDNSAHLDDQGFPAFAEVVEGMEAADSFARVEFHDQGGLADKGGIDTFREQFPEADYIEKAYIRE